MEIPYLMDILGQTSNNIDEDLVIKLPPTKKGFDTFPRIHSLDWTPTKLAFIPDVHFPKQDQRALDAMVACLRDEKPDMIILAGDVLDCAALTRHETPADRLMDVQFRLDSEIDAALPFLNELVSIADGNVYWIEGNHEGRRKRIIATHPGLIGVPALSARNMFRIPERITWIDSDSRLRVGNMYFEHGDRIINSRGSAHVANTMMSRRPFINTFTGHWHCVDQKSRVVYMPEGDTPETFMTACVGHLSNVRDHEHYAKLPNWTHGFAMFDVWAQGDKTRFNFYQIAMVDHEFVFHGKKYSGKKNQ